MSLKETPASGKAPLHVSFRAVAKPPRFLGFTYKTRGNYRAILTVYLSPQFTGTATRLLTFADVSVK